MPGREEGKEEREREANLAYLTPRTDCVLTPFSSIMQVIFSNNNAMK